MNKKALDEILAVADHMKSIGQDSTVPRNIRFALLEAAGKIASASEMDVEIGSAIYRMEDIANDINMPSHTRTELWNIISSLESVREKLVQK